MVFWTLAVVLLPAVCFFIKKKKNIERFTCHKFSSTTIKLPDTFETLGLCNTRNEI